MRLQFFFKKREEIITAYFLIHLAESHYHLCFSFDKWTNVYTKLLKFLICKPHAYQAISSRYSIDKSKWFPVIFIHFKHYMNIESK